MTQQQKQDYLAKPDHCPYCGSEDVGLLEWQDDQVTRRCGYCEREWILIVKIVDIKNAKGD